MSLAELAEKVSPQVESWVRGEAKPSLGELRALANLLKRPLATFFLPGPPKDAKPRVEFRHPHGSGRRELNFEERKALREASRQQAVLSWLIDELGGYPRKLPTAPLHSSPERVAALAREALGITVEQQQGFPSASAAFRAWREALEAAGVFVFVLPLGKEGCRGFSIWDERAPLIAVNSAWNVEARIFSLFHELGHLVTRTSSACAPDAPGRLSESSDTAERWCERFSAAFLIPAASLREHVGSGKVTELREAGRIARQFRVSPRAAVLRLIEADAADWPLYLAIPPASDSRRLAAVAPPSHGSGPRSAGTSSAGAPSPPSCVASARTWSPATTSSATSTSPTGTSTLSRVRTLPVSGLRVHPVFNDEARRRRHLSDSIHLVVGNEDEIVLKRDCRQPKIVFVDTEAHLRCRVNGLILTCMLSELLRKVLAEQFCAQPSVGVPRRSYVENARKHCLNGTLELLKLCDALYRRMDSAFDLPKRDDRDEANVRAYRREARPNCRMALVRFVCPGANDVGVEQIARGHSSSSVSSCARASAARSALTMSESGGNAGVRAR